MRVEPMEIQVACDKKYHCAHGVAAGVTTRLAFGSLEQTIECFEEAISLSSLCPSVKGGARLRPFCPAERRRPGQQG